MYYCFGGKSCRIHKGPLEVSHGAYQVSPAFFGAIISNVRKQMRLEPFMIFFQEVRNEYNQLLADTTEILNRFDDVGLHCRNHKTGWQPKANGPILYLGSQWVHCNQNEFMQAFVLSLASNYKEDMVRYVYRCCSVNV